MATAQTHTQKSRSNRTAYFVYPKCHSGMDPERFLQEHVYHTRILYLPILFLTQNTLDTVEGKRSAHTATV